MEWLALHKRDGAPAMKVGEEVLFACTVEGRPGDRVMALGRLQKARNAKGPFGPDFIIQSTWDGRPVDRVIPYAFMRPNPPEPK